MLWDDLSTLEQEAAKGLIVPQLESVGLSFADVDTELPQMYQILHSAGFSDPIPAILNAIDGIARKGVYGYTVEQLSKAFASTLDPIKDMKTYKQALIGHSVGNHFEGGHFNADLLDMHNAIKNLLANGSFVGAAAQTLQKTDEKLYGYALDLGNRMSQSINADDKLLKLMDEIIQGEAKGLIIIGTVALIVTVILAFASAEIGGIAGFVGVMAGIGLLAGFVVGIQQRIDETFRYWIAEQENQLRAIPAIPDVLTANE